MKCTKFQFTTTCVRKTKDNTDWFVNSTANIRGCLVPKQKKGVSKVQFYDKPTNEYK